MPLVTSAAGAPVEVAGAVARLVGSPSEQRIADGLRDIPLNEQLDAQLGNHGLRRDRGFDWYRCADGTVRTAQLAIARRRNWFPILSLACGR